MNELDFKSCPGGPGHAAHAYEGGYYSVLQRECPVCVSIAKPLKIGDRVLKYTGDYQLEGEIRAIFTTKAGKIRYVVEHYAGMLHIYSAANIKLVEE